MGSHKKTNVRGSGGRLTEGDKLARDVHGRRGMWKERREKGPSHQQLQKESSDIENLSDDEITAFRILDQRVAYTPPGLLWRDFCHQLGFNFGLETEEEKIEFIVGIQNKRPSWIIFNPNAPTEIYLNPRFREKIKLEIKSRMI